MAEYTFTVPNDNLDKSFGTLEASKIKPSLDSLRSNYGAIIDKASANSNVPSELLTSLIYVLSNGSNNTPYKSVDGLIRQGLFSLSNKTAKIILSREMAMNRLNNAEKEMLTSADPAIASYLGEKGKKGINEHWSTDFKTGENYISDTLKPFKLSDPNVSIQLGAIWLAMLWNEIGKQTKNPVDKVILTMALPYGNYAQNGSFLPGGGYFGGNGFVRGRAYTTDYTQPKVVDLVPKPTSKTSTASIINPNGGWAVDALRSVLGKNGAVDLLTKRS